MRPHAAFAASLLLTGVLVTDVRAFAKIAKIAPVCKDTTPLLRVDASGNADSCVQEAPARCPGGLELHTDAKGTDDGCVRPVVAGAPAGAAEKAKRPQCTSGLKLAARVGADVCERTAGPVCQKGFHLEPTRGEDRCVR